MIESFYESSPVGRLGGRLALRPQRREPRGFRGRAVSAAPPRARRMAELSPTTPEAIAAAARSGRSPSVTARSRALATGTPSTATGVSPRASWSPRSARRSTGRAVEDRGRPGLRLGRRSERDAVLTGLARGRGPCLCPLLAARRHSDLQAPRNIDDLARPSQLERDRRRGGVLQTRRDLPVRGVARPELEEIRRGGVGGEDDAPREVARRCLDRHGCAGLTEQNPACGKQRHRHERDAGDGTAARGGAARRAPLMLHSRTPDLSPAPVARDGLVRPPSAQ